MSRHERILERFWMHDICTPPCNHYKQVLTRNEYGQLVERVVFVDNHNYGNDETYAMPA